MTLPQDHLWQRIRQTIEGLETELLKCADTLSAGLRCSRHGQPSRLGMAVHSRPTRHTCQSSCHGSITTGYLILKTQQ